MLPSGRLRAGQRGLAVSALLIAVAVDHVVLGPLKRLDRVSALPRIASSRSHVGGRHQRRPLPAPSGCSGWRSEVGRQG
jgi:hypothetical protein